jgi:Pao retrotransposon peptidase
VDDCMAGDNDYQKLLKISQDLDDLVEQGGFKFKETHMSGDKLEDEVPRKVLGIFWDTESDTLKLDIKINFSGKRKGAKLAPDVDLEEEDIDEVTPEVVTKMMVWRVAQAQYDPMGLISPFMIQFKLVMRSLCSEERKVNDWDGRIPDSAVVAFKRAISGQAERMIGQMRKVLKSTLEGKSCSFNEVATILYEAATIINSRPVGIAGRESDLEAATPITPLARESHH